MRLILPYTPPYDWPAMLGFLAARAIPGVEIVAAERYARSIRIGTAGATIEIWAPAPDSGQHALHATISGAAAANAAAIVARLRHLFDLDTDPAMVARHLSADPLLAKRLAARPGLRVPGAWDGFELAVRAILGQQITVAGATRLAGRLVAALGARTAMGGLDRVFPTPDSLAGHDLSVLLGMPRARAAALSTMAARVAADPGLFDPGQGLSASVARLQALPGIGAWTAHHIAMRALREPDAFPAADIGLLRAMATAAGRPSPAQLVARAETWRPFRAYAALHLWTAAPESRITMP